MRYRFPPELGGGEHDEYRHVDGGTEAPQGTVAFLVNGCIVAVARALLVEVEPPLPPEPPLGSVVLDVTGRAWQHTGGHRGVWECCKDDAGADWQGLNADPFAPLTLLVPVPEPVDLPWTSEPDLGHRVIVGFLGAADPVVTIEAQTYNTSIHVSNPRAMARALWSAADARDAKAGAS